MTRPIPVVRPEVTSALPSTVLFICIKINICCDFVRMVFATKCSKYLYFLEVQAFCWPNFLRHEKVKIAVGRSTRDHPIDVDLSLEGPASKVSRRQAAIRLRNSGDFFISSEGKRPIFVDGRPVLQGNKAKLNHNSVIEIAGLRFVFHVNQELISAICQEAVKVNIPV